MAPILAFAQNDDKTFDQRLQEVFDPVTAVVNNIIFFEISVAGFDIPFVLPWLIVGAIVFTIYMGFINIRGFKHALDVVRGKFDNPNDAGEVSHFQALTAALSGTVGVGNIAGVALAVGIGGPGATFWMIIAGLLGMTSKFVEVSLGLMYRKVNDDGTVSGGPMHYLDKGLKEKGMGKLGKVLAVLFAIFCIGGSFGGGNMVQINQATNQLITVTGGALTADGLEAFPVRKDGDIVLLSSLATVQQDKRGEAVVIPSDIADLTVLETAINAKDPDAQVSVDNGQINVMKSVSPFAGRGWIFGLIMAITIGIVIIGGIKSIVKVTDKVVPFMVAIYVLGALVVLGYHFAEIPAAFGEIIGGAFAPGALYGGAIGVMIQGFRRAAFSNEAGVGSASIAHSAAKTDEPISEGIVALLEPFIDTVVICTMTALVIIITNYGAAAGGGAAWAYNGLDQNTIAQIDVTSIAFASVISWFPVVLSIAVILFALSTMVSWSYYGLKSWTYLFGESKTNENIYKVIFCIFVVIGSAISAQAVFDFGDAMIFAMCFPNVLGLYLLMPNVRRAMRDYFARIKSGEIKRYDA